MQEKLFVTGRGFSRSGRTGGEASGAKMLCTVLMAKTSRKKHNVPETVGTAIEVFLRATSAHQFAAVSAHRGVLLYFLSANTTCFGHKFLLNQRDFVQNGMFATVFRIIIFVVSVNFPKGMDNVKKILYNICV